MKIGDEVYIGWTTGTISQINTDKTFAVNVSYEGQNQTLTSNEIISQLETKIGDCGMADRLADIACLLIDEYEAGHNQNIHNAITELLESIKFYSGIGPVPFDILYDTIKQYFDFTPEFDRMDKLEKISTAQQHQKEVKE